MKAQGKTIRNDRVFAVPTESHRGKDLDDVRDLFAFLLTVPFSKGLTRMTQFEKVLYLVVLLATAFATFILIAPAAYHRFLFRQGRKGEVVTFANRATLIGLGFLAFAMVGRSRTEFGCAPGITSKLPA